MCPHTFPSRTYCVGTTPTLEAPKTVPMFY
jgi:hypothetical protein